MKRPVAAIKLQLRPGREYKSRFYREQSDIKMMMVPVISVMVGSMVTTMPLIVQHPLLAPMGFLIFLAWRLMRPEFWPMWAGLPLGLFDDMFSGQPFGSSGLLWSLTMLAVQMIDTRTPWRDYWQDWFIAGVLIVLALFIGLAIVGLAHNRPEMTILIPQILFSILIFPLIVRICARLDAIRLAT